MPVIQFDPLDRKFNADPYPLLRRLQEEEPVYELSAYGAWVVTRFDDVVSLLRSRNVTTDIRFYAGYTPPKGKALSPTEWFTTGSVLRGDTSRHARMRRLVISKFSRASATILAPTIERVTDRVLSAIQYEDGIDFMQAVARVIPVDVIADVVNIPIPDRAEFSDDARTFITVTNPLRTPKESEQLDAAIERLKAFLENLVSERAQESHPRDLISELLAAEHGGERLTREELVKLVLAILAAGVETMAALLGVSVLTLLENPQYRMAYLAGTLSDEQIIGEILRYRLMGKFLARFTKEAGPLHNRMLPAGALLFLCPIAAHRDPAAFPDPDLFDPTRDTLSNSIPFGIGEHRCVGEQLARLEGSIVLRRFLARFPKARLESASEQVEWSNELFGRAPIRLPISLQ